MIETAQRKETPTYITFRATGLLRSYDENLRTRFLWYSTTEAMHSDARRHGQHGGKIVRTIRRTHGGVRTGVPVVRSSCERPRRSSYPSNPQEAIELGSQCNKVLRISSTLWMCNNGTHHPHGTEIGRFAKKKHPIPQ